MKNRTIFPAFAILALCSTAYATWRIDQTKYLNFLRTTGFSGSAANLGPCQFATREECLKAIEEYARQMGDPNFARLAEPADCGGSGGSSGGSPQQQLAEGIANLIVGLLFKPKADNSGQAEIQRQNELKHQQEEAEAAEQRRQAANQAWNNLQNQEKELREIEKNKELEAGKDLLGKMETVGGGELKFKTIGTDFFGTSKPTDVALQPRVEGDYPTKNFLPMETLRGTAYFFAGALDAAASDGDYEKAAYLAGQADKVIQGQPTSMKINFASIPDVPAPPAPEQVSARKQELKFLLQTFEKKVDFLLDIEVKLFDKKEQIKEAEGKKEKARVKLEEAKKTAAAAKPEEKPKADELEKQAQALLQSADDELEKAKQAEVDMIREKEKTENEIKKMNAKIQGGGK